jgi:3-dehydroquinate synthase
MAPMLPASILEAWNSLAPEVRAALIATEMSSVSTLKTHTSVSSITSSGSSDTSGEKNSTIEEEEQTSNINSETDSSVMIEVCPEAGTKTILRPLERAPENVFEITKTTSRETVAVQKTASSTVTTKTTVMTTSKGWRNVFTLPISYDVNMVPNGTLLDPTNMQLLDSTGVQEEGYNTRFAVIDAAIDEIYGEKIRAYFTAQGIELTSIVIQGGEPDKRPAVSFDSVV